MSDSIAWGFIFGIFFILPAMPGFLLTYILIFYIYNRFIYKNAIYSDGFLGYYFLGYVIAFILFECFIALHVPFDFPYHEEGVGIDYPVETKYTRYNEFFVGFMPTYLIGSPIALWITKLINKLHKIDKIPHPLHRGKAIIFGVLAPSGLPLCSFVGYIIEPIVSPIVDRIMF